MERIYRFEGLDCADCAAKIEKQLNNLDGVINAEINFFSKKLTLKLSEDKNPEKIFKKVSSIVKKFEPDARISLISDQPIDNLNACACDIADEKRVSTTEDENEEDGGNRKKLIIKLVIGLFIYAIGVIFKFENWLELAIFIAAYIIVGGSVVLRALKSIAKGNVFNEHFLMSVATIGAFFVGEYPEAVAVMLFYLVGELFQDMAVDHSRKSISALMDIRPDYANLKVDGNTSKVSPEDVKTGDIIIVKPGEKIPLDGTVTEGTSMVDTSALTGESMPREIGPGDDALSGFVNKHGVLTIEVTKVFGESTVAKILCLIQRASCKKAPTENFITKFARYYTPVVVFSALALALIPPLLLPGATFSDWVYRALVFLVVSCPCALVISIPLGFFGGIGGASKKGILIKGSNYLEALNYVETVVFDKTGTLTKGVFVVTQINPQKDFSSDELIEAAAYAESFSSHPIALSIVNAYKTDKKHEIYQDKIENYQDLAGFGIKVDIDGKSVLVGNANLMENEKIDFSEDGDSGTVVYVAIGDKYAGYIIISDEIKEDAANAIKELKLLRIKKTVMLTGDLKIVGDKIGRQLGLDEVYSELLPDEKVDMIEFMEKNKTYKEKKGKIVFVGDGINDAPVLARADIGIAMGALGSDAAIEAADIVIMNDEPSKVASAIKIAKRTRVIVFQNIIFALGVKGIFLVAGAFGFATMWEAVFADMGVAILAILNAMRVMNTKNI